MSVLYLNDLYDLQKLHEDENLSQTYILIPGNWNSANLLLTVYLKKYIYIYIFLGVNGSRISLYLPVYFT